MLAKCKRTRDKVQLEIYRVISRKSFTYLSPVIPPSSNKLSSNFQEFQNRQFPLSIIHFLLDREKPTPEQCPIPLLP